jgi:hypothetical protein
MVSEELVKTFAQAVARAEGYGIPDSVPTRARNPGDLTDDGDVGQGLIHTSGPNGAAITVYATDEDGWNALYRKVRRMLEGRSKTYPLDSTLMEVALRYAGSPLWAANVARSLGVDTRATLAEIAAKGQVQQA